MARSSGNYCCNDPVYTVQSAKNYFNTAKRRSCLFRSCENYPPVYRNGLKPAKRENGENLGPFNDKPVHVAGEHRHLFFRRPVMPFLKPSVPTMRFYPNFQSDFDGLEKTLKDAEARCCESPDKTETKQTQTDYRESEAQTSPWTPPYKVREDESPEVLTIAHLTWGHGLPAGIHEVEIINRMRMKRAWEAILPPMDSQVNIKTRTTIIEAMEIDDWAFREAEIQFIMDMRMELMEKFTKLKEEAREKRISSRYERLEGLLADRKDQEVRSIRQRLGRELRKLAVKHRRGAESKRWKRCEAEPLGKKNRNYHEIINRKILRDMNIEDEESGVKLPTYSQLKAVRPKQKPSELCVRETRWNEEKLRQLHAELKSIRLDLEPEKKSGLMKRRYKLSPMPVTPILYTEDKVKNEKLEQAAVFVQKLVAGRAVQCVMFEGRDRCRELIEELQSTHWLQSETRKLRHIQKRHVIGLQRDENRRILQEDRLSEILNSLEGMTLAGMLDYLSKELVRLKDERKAHAFALLAERERNRREAEEAGRRQTEEQRRREHDEMFRQVVKVNQDSVELYLEDIIKEGIEWVSEAQARQYIHETAEKADKASRYANENAKDLLQEEMVSDMIYNFVLPDVEKEIVRKRMRQRQTSYLRNAHAAIYEKISDLPENEESRSFSETEYLGESEEEEARREAEIIGDEESKITKSETSVDWIKRRIIGEMINPGATLTGSILEELIRRSAMPDSQVIARHLTTDLMKKVEALVENSQLSTSISGSSGSSYSSESSTED